MLLQMRIIFPVYDSDAKSLFGVTRGVTDIADASVFDCGLIPTWMENLPGWSGIYKF